MQRRNVLQLTGATFATAVGAGWVAIGENTAQEDGDPIEFGDSEELLLQPDSLPGDGWERGDPEDADILDVEVSFTREFEEGEEVDGDEGDIWIVVSAVAGRDDADAGADVYEELETEFVETVGEARVMDLDLASDAVIAGYDGLTSVLFRDVNCVAAVSFTNCVQESGRCASDVARVEELARTQQASWRAPPEGGNGKLEVVEIHEDAQGDDHENLNDEYVVFGNSGESGVDLTGWRVEDDAEHVYRFPEGFKLDTGQEVTLFSGSGEDTETELYWGSEQAIWNNSGDTIHVYDENGESVVEREYS